MHIRNLRIYGKNKSTFLQPEFGEVIIQGDTIEAGTIVDFTYISDTWGG